MGCAVLQYQKNRRCIQRYIEDFSVRRTSRPPFLWMDKSCFMMWGLYEGRWRDDKLWAIKRMSLFSRLSPEFASSADLHEAIMDSVSSVRDSLPKEHHEHFETLRQEIIDFAKAHDIPRESLAKPNALREAAEHLSIPDLQRLATLLERFEYLLVHHEPKKEDYAEALEYAERLYHLKEQYTSQVALLEQVGILKDGVIEGIDGNKYPVPTLEQIASRLFERREGLSTKHDQGFTKLLLVPFGMSLNILLETLKQFLIEHEKNNRSFNLDADDPLCTWVGYEGADIGDSPKLVYYPQSFTREGHGGKTKAQILKEQAEGQLIPALAGVAGEKGERAPGWIVHLLQSSSPSNPHSPGLALIPREGKGILQGNLTPRPPLEAGKSSEEYLSILQKAQDDEYSPYHGETGMTPEDWIMAFMLHLTETGKPLDDVLNPTNTASYCHLTGAFFPFPDYVPGAYLHSIDLQVRFSASDFNGHKASDGTRSSVIV